MKIVPVLARSRLARRARCDSAYEKIGCRRDGPRGDDAVDADRRAIDVRRPSDADKLRRIARAGRHWSALGARRRRAPIEQSDNSLVRLINSMIVEAHAQGVSDIHIES